MILYVFFDFLQLENYSKTEEAKVEELIKAVADSGAKVIVSGGAVGEMALHFCERYKCVKSYLFCCQFLQSHAIIHQYKYYYCIGIMSLDCYLTLNFLLIGLWF